jgi:hypothetical protein
VLLKPVNTSLSLLAAFVDGVSFPIRPAFSRRRLRKSGREYACPARRTHSLLLKGGKPVLASVATGIALGLATLQNLVNILMFGMDPETSASQPNTQGAYFGLRPDGTIGSEVEKNGGGRRVSAGGIRRSSRTFLVDQEPHHPCPRIREAR